MKYYPSILLLVLLSACGIREGSEQWCDAMLEKPNQQWTDAETRLFAKHCLYE